MKNINYLLFLLCLLCSCSLSSFIYYNYINCPIIKQVNNSINQPQPYSLKLYIDTGKFKVFYSSLDDNKDYFYLYNEDKLLLYYYSDYPIALNQNTIDLLNKNPGGISGIFKPVIGGKKINNIPTGFIEKNDTYNRFITITTPINILPKPVVFPYNPSPDFDPLNLIQILK